MRRFVNILVAIAALPAVASVAVPASVEDLARASDVVVRGHVSSTASEWRGGRIFTFAEIETASVWRGSAPSRTRVLTPGGAVGRIGQRVDGAAAFAAGEDVVVFLTRAEADAFRVTGMAQGKFLLSGGVARPDLGHTTFVQGALRAGERQVGEMSAEELERRVRAAR
jgi:hypothetical protein